MYVNENGSVAYTGRNSSAHSLKKKKYASNVTTRLIVNSQMSVIVTRTITRPTTLLHVNQNRKKKRKKENPKTNQTNKQKSNNPKTKQKNKQKKHQQQQRQNTGV